MPVDAKGKQILREPTYNKFRQLLINDIMKTIDLEGTHGGELKPIIEKTLKEEKFKDLVSKLLQCIVKETDINVKDCPQTLSMLMEEDIADDIKRDLQDQVEERHDGKRDKETERIYREGTNEQLWKDIPSRYLGQRASLINDIFGLIKENIVIKLTFLIGFVLLGISSILFKSVYKAVIAGLTLTAMPAISVTTMIANIIGAVGGILIFFVSLSLVFQYLFLAKSRDERIRELAHRSLEKRGK